MPAMADKAEKTFANGDSESGKIGDTGVITYSSSGSVDGTRTKYLSISSKNSLTISTSSSEYAIASVKITFYSSSYAGGTKSVTTTPTTFVGTASGSTTYTISINNCAQGVTLTAGNSSMRITGIVVDYNKLVTPSISLSSVAGTELTKGQLTVLETTTDSDGELSYASNNTSVATVTENGVVATVGVGEVTLTASVSASNKYKAASASITLTVAEAVADSWTVDSLLTIQGVTPVADGKTLYYLKNVGTGLNINYGGEFGTHCIESQSAHPLILEANPDGSYAIASLAGYLESNTLWMDSTKYCTDVNNTAMYGRLVSKWKFVPVDGYPGQYYIVGDDDRYLSSVGNRSGLLVLKSNESKAFQRWIFTTGPDIKKSLMPHASAELPVDVTVAIRGASFDLVDDYATDARNAPKIFSEKMMPYLSTYWENYATFTTWVWHRGIRTWNPEEYNFCNILSNLTSSANVSYDMKLPPGAYRFTCEGFYRYESPSSTDNVYVRLYNTNDESTLNTITLARNTALTYGVNTEAAVIFRDNDDYLQEATFFLKDTTDVQIQIDRDGSSNQLIYLDNFNLYYTGFPAEAPALVQEPIKEEYIQGLDMWMTVYVWNVETQSYDRYGTFTTGHSIEELNKLYETAMDEYNIYNDIVDAIDPYINEALAAADDNIIYKNYLNANINAYEDRLGETGKDVFAQKLEEYGVDPDNINSRVEYYEAIALIEQALDDAEVADAKAEALDKIEEGDIDFTGAIYNPSFELGNLYNHNEARGWTVAAGHPSTFIVANANDVYKTDGVDGARLFNNWWTGTHLTQTVSELPAGTYILSALIASGDEFTDIDGVRDFTVPNDGTVYLTTGDGEKNRRGVKPPRFGKVFGDYSKKLVVADEKGGKGTAVIGIIGGNDDDDNTSASVGSYNPNGHWWYKCDNFRLEYLPNGRLPLRDEDTKIKNLIDPFVGVDVTRSISTGNWSTLVLPFDMPCPSDWEVETLNVVDQYDGDVRLTFSAIDKSVGLKAGVPYIVKVGSAVTSISAENVSVNTTLLVPGVASTTEQYDVEFVPVYTSGYVPASELEKNEDGTLKKDDNGDYIPTGAQYYFLSGGKLKRCVYDAESGKGNKIKGFRAYFKVTPKTAEARMALRSLSMRTSEETDIENVAEEEVTVIGIYDVNGIRLSEMKSGINILRMNNGTTKKVMVK